MSKFPKVTIIVLNFNGLEDTAKCLKSLTQTKYSNFEIIVGDNGSDKNEAEILSKKFTDKKINFVRFPKNLGFCGGNNTILKTIKDEYVVLLNNDVIVPPAWLLPLIKTMEENSSVAVVQPKILWAKNKQYFDYSGACGGFIDIFGYPFTRGRIFDTIEKDKGQYDSCVDIFWASGAAMMIRRDVLDKVGYFDERFFNYMEEIDLCFRIHQLGLRVVCQPKSYVYHKVASTASRNMMLKRYWEHRNNLLLILKNYPMRTLIFILPLRILLEYISLLYYLYIRRFDYALALIKSQISLFFIAPLLLSKRILTNNHNSQRVISLMYKRSVVLAYFFFKKRKFSSL